MKFGFACKYITNDRQMNGVKPSDDSYPYNVGTTTVTHLDKQSIDQALAKLEKLANNNLASILKLVTLVSNQPDHFRMLRLSSDILPLYTHKKYHILYNDQTIRSNIERQFAHIGTIARSNNIKLSFHPGQFCVLASDREDVVNNSIKEFEYHTTMAQMMGYGSQFQDFKINIHLSGRGSISQFRKTYDQLSDVAKNCITVENDEYTSDLEQCLQLSDICPIVFDIHHEFIHNNHILNHNDILIKRVIDSWCGVRPTMHYSQSREEYFNVPNIKRGKLRAHSDYYHDNKLNDHVYDFLQDFDIMLECKSKNLGRDRLYEYYFN